MTVAVHFSSAHPGRDTRIFHKELQTLSKAGYNAHCVVFEDGVSKEEDGVTIHRLGEQDLRVARWQAIPTLTSAVVNLDPDVCHFHDIELLPAGLWLKHSVDTRVIYDAHEHYPPLIYDREWIPDVARPILGATLPRIESGVAERLDGVVAASEYIASSLRDRGVSDVTTVHNYPKIADIDIQAVEREPDAEYGLAYVGALNDMRGLTAMIRVVAELRDRGQAVSLVCLGEFQSNIAEKEARSLIEDLGLTEQIEFPGYVDYSRMFDYLSAADLGLALFDIDRYRHRVPTKLFEYMYAETPPVVTNIRAADRYVSEEWAAVVPENDPEAQAATIEELLSDSVRRAEMGRAGNEAVKTRYSWEAEEKRLLELYEELLAGT